MHLTSLDSDFAGLPDRAQLVAHLTLVAARILQANLRDFFLASNKQ